MKKITIIGAGAILLLVLTLNSGCKNEAPPTGTVIIADTTGLAEFRESKMKQQVVTAQKNTYSQQKTVTMTSSSSNEAKVSTKKGWSKAAKYAVVGGTGGAVMGAVINKKAPVKGAVIGAVILGGGGYIYGRSQDKKDRRY